MYLTPMSINNIVWQHGGMAACISIILSLVGYLLGVEMMVGWQIGAAQMALILVTMALMSRAIRTDEGGYISFGRLFSHTILAALCIVIAQQLFNFFLYNFINPDLVNLVVEVSKDSAAEMLESFNVTGDILDQTMLETEAAVRHSFTLAGILQGILYSMIFWFIPSAIISGVMKRNIPSDFK